MPAKVSQSECHGNNHEYPGDNCYITSPSGSELINHRDGHYKGASQGWLADTAAGKCKFILHIVIHWDKTTQKNLNV